MADRKFFLSMLGMDQGLENLMLLSVVLAVIGAAYAIFGGLRAVAVSDTYSGVLILSLALVVVFLALKAINFDLSGIPAERLTLIGDNDSDIPWHTLLTGMIFIQTFYWSTNQTITQRAMASPTVKEAQKGVMAAAGYSPADRAADRGGAGDRFLQAVRRCPARWRLWQDRSRGAALLAVRRVCSGLVCRRADDV